MLIKCMISVFRLEQLRQNHCNISAKTAVAKLFANNVARTQKLMEYNGHWLQKQKDKNSFSAKQYSFDMHLFRHFHFV